MIFGTISRKTGKSQRPCVFTFSGFETVSEIVLGYLLCYNTDMIKVEKIIPGGQSLGTNEDGKKIFFWNALPGEVVEEYEVTKNKSHYQEAIATKISNPSQYRVKPLEECYLSTSPWQIIDYTHELQLKQELVTEIFHEHHINIDTPEILTDGKDYHYRNNNDYNNADNNRYR